MITLRIGDVRIRRYETSANSDDRVGFGLRRTR
jgi:hypothetical protein